LFIIVATFNINKYPIVGSFLVYLTKRMVAFNKTYKSKGFHMWFRSGKEVKNTGKVRGLHFYNSVNRRKLKKELIRELENIENEQ